MEYKGYCDTSCNWCAWNGPQKKRSWKSHKLEDEWSPSKLQHCWDQPKYWEESWRFEKIYCCSDSSKKPSVNILWKLTRTLITIIINNIQICILVYINVSNTIISRACLKPKILKWCFSCIWVSEFHILHTHVTYTCYIHIIRINWQALFFSVLIVTCIFI